jgi:hypothetical protein
MFRGRNRRDKADAPDEIDGLELDAEPTDEAEVEAEDEAEAEAAEDQPEDMTADLESQAADYLAGNDIWMYGPNAEAVLEIIDRLEEITPDEARPLAEAWQAIPKSDREQARKAARKSAENDAEIYRYLQLAREAVGSWLSVTGPYPEYVAADPDWGRNCAKVAEAALDAATAVILEGTLEETLYVALLDPWSETIAQIEAAAEVARIEGPGADELEAGEDDEADDEVEGEGEFGPNSDSITDFLNRLWLLAPEQVGRLVSGWQNADRDALAAAHESLRDLVEEDAEWRDQVRKAQEKLAPWLNAGRVEDTAGFLGQAGQGESRKMAGPALADAVAALVLGDLLERPDAEALYGAWFNLIGAPPLPAESEAEPAEEDEVGAKTTKGGAKSPAKGGAKSPAKAGDKPAAKGDDKPAKSPKTSASGKTKPKASKKK